MCHSNSSLDLSIERASSLKGEIHIPGDKSISHRAVMLGSIADGLTEITNFLQGADCLSTIDCFQKMGVDIQNKKDSVLIRGNGLHGLKQPNQILDCGNSGTTTRMISGILAGQSFSSELTGDSSIQKRPMNRVIAPLTLMGAHIESVNQNGCAPLLITGSPLKGISYVSEIASAQVKSSILFAGLYADGVTSVTEPYLSRNHTEIMLKHFGGNICSSDTTVTLTPGSNLFGKKVEVPGDISSAAYFIAAGLMVPNSEILIHNVGINQTRDGILKVLQSMHANIQILNMQNDNGEAVCDLLVKTSTLSGTTIEGGIIPSLIDEIPILAVLASYANGQTIIKDAAELKVKESNRIDAMVAGLSKMGIPVQGTPDGMIIEGGHPLTGAVIDSHMDHRIAMSFTIAGLIAEGTTVIKDSDCVRISYPDFFSDLKKLQQ